MKKQQFFIIKLHHFLLFIKQKKSMIAGGINEHLAQAKEYMLAISYQGLDINALYIAEAYLTTLQTTMRPLSVLATLFAKEDLETMFQFCCSESCSPRSLHQISQRIINQQLLKYFKTSSSHQDLSHDDHSYEELSRLVQRILESLEEWSIIIKRAKKLQQKLEKHRSYLKETEGLKSIEQSLDHFLDNLLKTSNHAEFTTLESENESYSQEQSSPFDKGTPQIEKQANVLSKVEIVQFLGYLSMWMNQVTHEICEYKAILELTKPDSSVENDLQLKFKACSNPKKKRVAKMSLLTSKIKEGHLDIPKIETNFFDENERAPSSHSRRSVVNYPLSEIGYQKRQQRTQSHRVILGNMNSNDLGVRKERKARNQQHPNCSQCQIY